MLKAENPSMTDEQAYIISETSGTVAAGFETIAMNFITNRLPGVSQLLRKFRSASVTSPIKAGILAVGGATGIETLTELAQDYTASLTQEIFGAFDEDIPEVNLVEQLGETIRQAPDIALAVLPFALLAGGNAQYITLEAQQNLVSDPQRLAALGLDFDQITAIVMENDLPKAIAAFQEHFDLGKSVATLLEAREKGMDFMDLVNPEDIKAMKDAVDRDDAPQVNISRDEKKGINAVKITTPDGKQHSFQTVEESRKYLSKWFEENPEPKKYFRPIEEQFTPEQLKTFDKATLTMVQYLEAASTAQGRDLVVTAKSKVATFEELEKQGLISKEEVDAAIAYNESQGSESTG